ncbi:MAG: Sterol 3-beta-glucosyltransferase [Pleopsidium flavum]|nr:MAG: Sterol 3-beta-glucosyltransferase [Pleopsidium flavum]
MHPDGDLKRKIGRKLTKKRKIPRDPTVEIPEKFKDGDDAEEDAAACRGKDAQMNQSVFSMVAAAGSKVDFHARFDDESSDSDGESGQPLTTDSGMERQSVKKAPQEHLDEPQQAVLSNAKTGKHRRKLSEHKLLKSLPRLHLRTIKEKNYLSESDHLPSKEADSPTSSSKTATPRDAPVMSRMLEAEAQAQLHSSTTSQDQKKDLAAITEGTEGHLSPTSLAVRLMEIFGYEKPEEVISEYPCWLLQSVLLQGYMYITQNHICFYAYLPKKSNLVAKSGHLSKKGRQTPKYNRFWFTLKGDVLSYYTDPSDLYFPSGNIDLRYGISASLSEPKEKGKHATSFTVTTHQRTYFFKADSAASAKEWVKTLQKVIFRSHNDGDSVKISLPIENVIDIEESPVLEFAETFKIRVIDSDETYAIDEYFFSFFSFGKDALDVLRIMVDDTLAQKVSADALAPLPGDGFGASQRESAQERRKSQDLLSHSPTGASTPILRESVRATLAPLSPHGNSSPRISGDWGRSSMDMGRHSVDLDRAFGRVSFDRDRRSASTSRMSLNGDRQDNKSPSSKLQGSSDSYVHSLEQGTESSAPIHSSNDTRASASQILNRSDVFQLPTIQRLQRFPSGTSDDIRRHSEDTARTAPMNADVRIHPPSRAQTQKSTQNRYPSHGGDATSDSDRGSDANRGQLQQSNSSPALHQLVKAGAYPLQRAAGFAGYIRNRSKKMSNLLATESMGYVEKVSGMWTGGRKHYGDAEGVMPEDRLDDLEDEDDAVGHGDRFRAHFALPASERLRATYFGYLHRVLPLYGKVYIGNTKFCFRSLLPGTRTKMILPLKDIENVDKEKGFRFGYSGLVIVIRGHEELFFEFSQPETRDDCAVTLLDKLESVRYLKESGILSQEDKEDAEAAVAEHRMLQQARQDGHNEHELKLPHSVNETSILSEARPILFDDPRASIINFKPTESLRITCLTIGSRGDVQPYIALCKGLIAEGHKPKIATHAEFEPWVRKHGIDFAPVDGDPAELMRICVENGMFTYSFLREASVKFRGWIDELLTSAWKACQNTDILIESPSAMAGIHIAEALGIPYFRAFTMPWTRTRAYPHAFAVPEHKMGGAYNYVTYVMFDNVFWKAIAGQVNRWRKKELGLRSTNLDKMQPNKVPFLYNFSPSVVVPPLDYSDWIRVTGYWFLDEAAGWEPPEELTKFIRKAREDKKRIVYIGFGSIVVSDPAALTKTVVESVLKADVRCILSKGWSDRLGNKNATVPEVPLPPEILQIKSAPHDWLFMQIDAAAHHGGAGTTGASLRAGLPTIVKPFFGDQFFFGSRIEDLGVGICMKKLNVSVFSRALWEATHSERMIVKAKVLGEQIRQEHGVDNAIQAIYRDLEYAKSLIKKRVTNADDEKDDFEESWTFIGDESDPELTRRIAEWEPMAHMGHGDRSDSVHGIGAKGSSRSGVITPALGGRSLKRSSVGLSRTAML